MNGIPKASSEYEKHFSNSGLMMESKWTSCHTPHAILGLTWPYQFTMNNSHNHGPLRLLNGCYQPIHREPPNDQDPSYVITP